MAEPRARKPLQVHVDYAFDRLLESKLAQAYDIFGAHSGADHRWARIKEFDNEDCVDLRWMSDANIAVML